MKNKEGRIKQKRRKNGAQIRLQKHKKEQPAKD
jgi:hypothetical protein